MDLRTHPSVHADSDHALLSHVAEALAIPRRDPANSFVLHASLEFLARTILLRLVRPDARDAARERLRWLADEYERAGDPVDAPRPVRPDPNRLLAALRAGDLDTVDEQAVALANVATAPELRAILADPIVRSLAAAAHGSILLHLLDRSPSGAPIPLGLARQALREMARNPTWNLSWFEDPDEPEVTRSLTDALLDTPHLGLPGSSFIHPLMHQAESSGLAPHLLRGIVTGPAEAERDLSRVAAWSMLQEPPDHAPYGWSHCLTMSQATIRLADRSSHALAVAATYVVGFRAALGTTTLDSGWRPDPESREAHIWFDPSPSAVSDLASVAAAHEDAHLAKYTLACIQAAAHDPTARSLYVTAAARLGAWWAEHDAASETQLTGSDR